MAIVQCKNAHYFDDNLNESCPYCFVDKSINVIDRSPEGIKKLISNIPDKTEYNTSGENITVTKSKGKTLPSSEQKTIAKYDKKSKPAEDLRTVAKKGSRVENKKSDIREDSLLYQEINLAFGNGKIEDGKTISLSKRKLGFDPVVGWLVCVDGEERGNYYPLKPGKNLLEHSKGNGIFKKDSLVSNINHVAVIYDMKTNIFTLVINEDDTIYINENIITEKATLESYDRIRIDDTVLDFIAYCKGDIRWETE